MTVKIITSACLTIQSTGLLLADATSRADVSWGLFIGEDGLGHTFPVLVNSISTSLWVSIRLTNKGLEEKDFLGNLIRGHKECSQFLNSCLAGFTVNLCTGNSQAGQKDNSKGLHCGLDVDDNAG